jgi:hypothetical protein
MPLTSGALEIGVRALEHVILAVRGRPARPFFMFETRNPQEATRHAVEAPEPSR